MVRSRAGVCEREDHDVLACDLVGNPERKAIEYRHSPVWSVAPLRCRVRKLKLDRLRGRTSPMVEPLAPLADDLSRGLEYVSGSVDLIVF
jgi:hypothetical protein